MLVLCFTFVMDRAPKDDFLFEYPVESQKWRIETSATHLDFKAGGKIIVGEREFIILKVLTIITSGTTPNKFMAMNTPKGFERFAPKMLAII